MVFDHAVVPLSTELHPDVASDEAMRRQGRVRRWGKRERTVEEHPLFRPSVLGGEYGGAAAERRVGKGHLLLSPGVLMVVGERAVRLGCQWCRGVQWDWEQGEEGKGPRTEIADRGSGIRSDTRDRKRREG